MKKTSLFAGLLLLSVSVQAQHEFTIEGKVKGLKDGEVMTLLRWDGRVGSSIATDTVHNESFRFKEKTLNEVDKLSVSPRSEGFPPMSLTVYATPNANIKISGNDNLLYTWKVDSSVKEQQEANVYMEATRELWNDFQRIGIEDYNQVRVLQSSTATDAEKEAARAKRKECDGQQDPIQISIAKKEMEIMQRTPVTSIWLEKLYGLSMDILYTRNFPYRDEVIALYNKLSEADKKSEKGSAITVNLFPPTVVKEGEEMADADLYDLEGKVHHLADFKGKYMLLDFWSSGCGPCIMALPEMKEIQEQYKDRLTLISISSDTERRWKAASQEHEMTWQNLNDMKQTSGLYAKYGVRGIPNYVLISPEGKVVRMWSGYGPGSLKQKMKRLVDAEKHEMSITKQGNVQTIHYPKTQSNNTDEVLEIKQIELKPDATIVRFKAYYTPNYWIQLATNASLSADKGTKCTVKSTEGITLGEHFFLPDSGEAEFSLIFEPLPTDAKTFDFSEGETGAWQIKGVALTK